jgi:hypothetical protein
MSVWKSSFAGILEDFDTVFDRYEMLGSLAAFEYHDEADLENAKNDGKSSNQPLGWMPVGRFGWRSDTRRVLLAELANESSIRFLLGAGFGKNSRKFLQLFVSNVEWYADWMSLR